MNQQSYQSLTYWFYQRPILNKILVSCCRLFPYSMFFLYAVGSVCPVLSHFLFYGFDAEYLLFWIIPAVGFCAGKPPAQKSMHRAPMICSILHRWLDMKAALPSPVGTRLAPFLIFSCFALDFLHNLFPIPLVILSGVLAFADRCLPHSCRTSFSKRCVLRCAVFPLFSPLYATHCVLSFLAILFAEFDIFWSIPRLIVAIFTIYLCKTAWLLRFARI